MSKFILSLCSCGLFLAGTLSLGSALGVAPPCLDGDGCGAVLSSPLSRIGRLPLAYLGVVLYGTLATATLLRSTFLRWRVSLFRTAYVLSTAGSGVSIYLSWLAISRIGQLCVWCVLSAICLLLLTCAHALEATRAEVGIPGKRDGWFALGLGAWLLVGIAWMGVALTHPKSVVLDPWGEVDASVAELVPTNAHGRGDPDALVTVLVFADLQCQGCTEAMPMLKSLVEEHGIRLIYRHLPIQGHSLSFEAAVLSELAADHGRFWAFIDAFHAAQPRDRTEMLAMAKRVFPFESAQLDDAQGPARARVQKDLALAKRLGIIGTPATVLLGPGLKARMIPIEALEKTILTLP